MIKSDTKDLLQNMSNSNTLKQIILGKITVFKIDNNNMMKNKLWAPNQHISTITKGSRDTEDWSNDC